MPLGVLAAVVRRPDLWATAAVEVLRLAPTGWWRRWPPLPIPDRDYLRFRLVTQYGDPDHHPEPSDVVAWLEWCRGYRAMRPRKHRSRGLAARRRSRQERRS